MSHDVVVAVRGDALESLRAKFAAVLPHLDERQQRLMLAGEAVLPHLHELAGTALTSHDVIVQSIAATTTRTGLACTPNSTPPPTPAA